MTTQSTWFQRILLPGFAFKAVVIGGGYATGRELVSFFLPAGPRGGLAGMALAMLIWSAVCTVTFLYAMQTESRDYRTFFHRLLGPFWPSFEIAYCLAMIVTIAVFAAAAGAIGQALFNWQTLAGSLVLMVSIAAVTSSGNDGVEQLFKYVSIFLYSTYGVFLGLSLAHFGPRIEAALGRDIPVEGWIGGGLTYAGYNVVAAVVILPVLRHLRTRRDAIMAGLLAGPLAMLPAMLFFISIAGFYPQIRDQLLPSDFLLGELHVPVFRYIFQAMIFAALLEGGAAGIHAINERIARAYEARTQRKLSNPKRFGVTVIILIGSGFVANRIGLVALIANGYRFLAYLFLAIFVLPIMTYGLWNVCRRSPESPGSTHA
jgi:uncharacterized membrane protein YkvI